MTYHHLSVLVHRQAEKYGDKIALKYRDYETAQWIPISWKEFSQTVRRTANAMVALGIEPQENIGIFSQKKPESLFLLYNWCGTCFKDNISCTGCGCRKWSGYIGFHCSETGE